MTTAQLVNLISDKLRTGRVEFLAIEGERVRFRYGHRTYESFENHDGHVSVMNIRGNLWTAMDSYSLWIGGVLNNKTRDDNGVLS